MINNDGAEDRLLAPKQVADLLAVHPDTLKTWRTDRRGPRFVRIEGQIRYWASDVTAYLTRNTVDPKESGDSLLDIPAAAAYFDVSEQWVRLHLDELTHTRVGNRIRFREADLDDYLASHSVPSAAVPA